MGTIYYNSKVKQMPTIANATSSMNMGSMISSTDIGLVLGAMLLTIIIVLISVWMWYKYKNFAVGFVTVLPLYGLYSINSWQIKEAQNGNPEMLYITIKIMAFVIIAQVIGLLINKYLMPHIKRLIKDRSKANGE
jgi:hypothetical protein